MKKTVVCFLLAFCLCSTVVGCSSKKEEATVTEEKQEKEEVEKKYLVIGNKTEDAYDIYLKNSTGQDITGISIKTSDKTEWPANMMKTGDVLKKDDTAELFYTPEKVETSEGSESEKAVNVVYNMQITLADGTVFELSSLGFEDIKDEAELCYEDQVGYVRYISSVSGDSVNTKEQELGAKAQREAQEAAAKAAEAASAQAEAQSAENVQEASQPASDYYYEETYPSDYYESAPEEPAETAPEQSTDNCLGDVIINN